MQQEIKWDAPAEVFLIEENPMPANGQIGYLQARDGKLLRNGVFMPEGEPRGTIVLMTGYSEFLEKYFETIGDFTKMGFCVALLEWRGHGLSQGNSSDPERLHLDDFDQNVEDLEDRYDRLVRAYCPAPYVGFAHSMGGLISFRAAHKHPDWFAALAQSAPMYGITLPASVNLVRAVATPILLALTTGDRWNPLDPPNRSVDGPAVNHITNDARRFARGEKLWRTDTRLLISGRSLGWSSTAFKTMARNRKPAFLRQFKTPLFVGTSEQELLVDNAAHDYVLSHVQNGQGKRYPGAKHELVMELDATREAFLADVDTFYHSVLEA
jgi:lysophospholipase